MDDKLLALLTKLATGKLIIVCLLLVIAVNAFLVPAVYPSFETLDMRSSYTPQEAYQLIRSYGEEGRHYYALIEVTLDLVYPILWALLFSLLTIYLFRRAFPPNSFWQNLPLLGPIVMLVDYLENASIITMLLSYPRRLEFLAQVANIFTGTKSVLSWLQLILIVIGLLGWVGKTVYRSIKKRTESLP
jgi:hypothetical protein